MRISKLSVMKKVFFTAIILAIIGVINAQPQTYVPDDNFEQALIELGYDTVIDDSVTTAIIVAVTSLDVEFLGILDLTGIEDFTALTKLNCSSNPLNNLDIAQNTALDSLSCYSNSLKSLDVSSNTALTYLSCGYQLLTSLNVSQNTSLTYLNCYSNKLTSLDLSQNTALGNLVCFRNKLTSLDLSKNTALGNLVCYENELTSLDLNQNTALDWLVCSNNQLTSLDISQNTELIYLDCSDNQLTCLNVKNGNNNSSHLYDINANYNPNLTCIEVDDVAWSTTRWTDIDPQTSFSTNCNNACSSSALGINEYNSSKTLIKMFDIMGREATFKPNTLFIYLYDDGSTGKVLTVE